MRTEHLARDCDRNQADPHDILQRSCQLALVMLKVRFTGHALHQSWKRDRHPPLAVHARADMDNRKTKRTGVELPRICSEEILSTVLGFFADNPLAVLTAAERTGVPLPRIRLE